jgi:hypothetical protein
VLALLCSGCTLAHVASDAGTDAATAPDGACPLFVHEVPYDGGPAGSIPGAARACPYHAGPPLAGPWTP